MSTKSKVKDALSAVEDALNTLLRAQQASPTNHDIRRAISELEDAETLLRRALREVRRLESDS